VPSRVLLLEIFLENYYYSSLEKQIEKDFKRYIKIILGERHLILRTAYNCCGWEHIRFS
jgi:hypothetical protein